MRGVAQGAGQIFRGHGRRASRMGVPIGQRVAALPCNVATDRMSLASVQALVILGTALDRSNPREASGFRCDRAFVERELNRPFGSGDATPTPS